MPREASAAGPGAPVPYALRFGPRPRRLSLTRSGWSIGPVRDSGHRARGLVTGKAEPGPRGRPPSSFRCSHATDRGSLTRLVHGVQPGESLPTRAGRKVEPERLKSAVRRASRGFRRGDRAPLHRLARSLPSLHPRIASQRWARRLLLLPSRGQYRPGPGLPWSIWVKMPMGAQESIPPGRSSRAGFTGLA